MDLIDVKQLIVDKKDNVLVPMVQNMSENFAKAFETGVEVGIEIGKGLNPNYAKVWHTPNDEPNEDEEILYEWGSNDATWHNVAFFHKDTKNFTLDHKHQKYLNEVTKWAYIKDLV